MGAIMRPGHLLSLTALTGLIACGGDDAEPKGDSGSPQIGDSAQETGDTAPSEALLSQQLVDAIAIDGLLAHLDAFQVIADENGGNRNAGDPGFEASLDYATAQFESYGYTVERDEFTFSTVEELSDPALEQTAPNTETYASDQFATFAYSGSGDATANVQSVDLMLPPGSESNSSTSGCESDDFADFTSGSIALIQRGSCTFQTKVDNAVTAGAVGVLIFNEGQNGRTEVVQGQLDAEVSNTVPVLGLGFDLGETLAELVEASDLEMRVKVDLERVDTPAANLFVRTSTGKTDRQVVVGAHLDSVAAGAGINDNGTGSALILELARAFAEGNLAPDNQVVFALWGAEEWGLLGSIDWVFTLESDELANVFANLNFDMIGSPNAGRFVYDGDGSSGGGAGPTGSGEIESIFNDWFDAQGVEYEATPFNGRSDYGAFIYMGIPAGGLFTGAEGVKSSSQADKFGGESGQAFDPCYHQACDDIENLDNTMFLEMARAAAYATGEVAMKEETWGRSEALSSLLARKDEIRAEVHKLGQCGHGGLPVE